MVIRKTDGYILYSRRIDPRTGRRRVLGRFRTRAEAERRERQIEYFKRVRRRRGPHSPTHWGYVEIGLQKLVGR